MPRFGTLRSDLLFFDFLPTGYFDSDLGMLEMRGNRGGRRLNRAVGSRKPKPARKVRFLRHQPCYSVDRVAIRTPEDRSSSPAAVCLLSPINRKGQGTCSHCPLGQIRGGNWLFLRGSNF